MTEIPALLRERLIDAVGEPMTKPVVLLSGGVDSGMILAALLAAGHKPALLGHDWCGLAYICAPSYRYKYQTPCSSAKRDLRKAGKLLIHKKNSAMNEPVR